MARPRPYGVGPYGVGPYSVYREVAYDIAATLAGRSGTRATLGLDTALPALSLVGRSGSASSLSRMREIAAAMGARAVMPEPLLVRSWAIGATVVGVSGLGARLGLDTILAGITLVGRSSTDAALRLYWEHLGPPLCGLDWDDLDPPLCGLDWAEAPASGCGYDWAAAPTSGYAWAVPPPSTCGAWVTQPAPPLVCGAWANG